MLGVFNLIPGFPLDGGVVRAVVWGFTHNLCLATLLTANLGRFIAYLFIILGDWQMFPGNIMNGIWIAFIGWFMETAARGQVQQLAFRDMLAGHTVSQAMNRQYTTVSDDTTLQRLVDDHILGSGRRSCVVKRRNEAVGLLTLHHIKEVPRSEWPTTTSAQAMIPIERTKRVKPDAELRTALKEMSHDGVNQLPVMVDGQIQGMLSREDVITFLRTLQELGM